MGRQELEKQQNKLDEKPHAFLEGEAGIMLFAPAGKEMPAMIDPPAKVVPAALPTPDAKMKTGGLFSEFGLLCA